MLSLPFFEYDPRRVPAATDAQQMHVIASAFAEVEATGGMSGETLRKLMETAPRIVTTIVKHTPGTWEAAPLRVRWRRLLRMAEEGRLTADVLMRAVG